MNKKLKAAFKCRSSEQGFAIPIAVGMGLIMILIGSTMIVRSQGDQVTASAQKSTGKSLGVAETGITRVQSLLNRYRFLANITLTNIDTSSSSWKKIHDASITSACTPAVTPPSFLTYRLNEWITLANGDKFKIIDYTYKPDPYNFIDGTSGPRDPAQITAVGGGGANIIILGSDPSPVSVTPTNYLASGNSASGHIQGIQGTLYNNAGIYTFKRQYSVVASITLTSTEPFYPDKLPGVGSLKVEGQLGTGRTATSSLQVTIPVNAISLPGLWIKEGRIPPNNEINGDLMVSGCDTAVGGDVTGQRIANPYSSFPDLPARPTSNYNDLRGRTIPVGVTNENQMYVNNGTITAKRGSITFPSSWVGETYTTENGVQVYKYRINAIDLANDIIITPGKKVIFYVEQNIDTGSKEITHDYPTKPTNFQMFGYGTSSGDPLQPHFCMHGNGATYGFIFAPDYNVGVAGAGGNAGFRGSVWTRQWNPHPGGISSCGSNTGNTVVTQTANWDDLAAEMIPKNIPPKLSSISSWQRQEASTP